MALTDQEIEKLSTAIAEKLANVLRPLDPLPNIDVKELLTNKPSIVPYRGPGRPRKYP